MDTSKTIPKRIPDSDEVDFYNLKSEGLTRLQELCGETWTDYNLHDPGITILEQLCYALTELNYHAELPMADFLAGPDGKINYDHQALYLPQDIFPSQPITLNDYRKLIIDQVPEIDNIWFTTEHSPGGYPDGRYWAYARLHEPISNTTKHKREDILENIRNIYAENRNLCEDLQDVKVVEQRLYSLHGRIEVDGSRSPTKILADIYFQCARHVAQGVQIIPYAELLKSKTPLEKLFEGPLTTHGYIEPSQLEQARQTITVIDLIEVIGTIDGVTQVDELSFVAHDGQRLSSVNAGEFYASMPYLIYPASEAEIHLSLSKSDHVYPLTYRTLRFELDRLEGEYLAIRRSRSGLEDLNQLPTREYQAPGAYFSIQQQFPDVYGINENGIPSSAPPSRKAQARQLKTYLLFFEQVLANSLAQLQQAARLVSIDAKLKQSYFCQTLDNSNIGNIDELYTVSPAERQGKLEEIIKPYDNYEDRRDRIFDYLLSIYGESFSQHILHHLSELSPEENKRQEIIRNKLRFLTSLKELSSYRNKAFNYQRSDHDELNYTILRKKLAVLLGMDEMQEPIFLLEHILLRPRSGTAIDIQIDDGFFAFRFCLILPSWTTRCRNPKYRQLAQETLALNTPSHLTPYIHWLEPNDMKEFVEKHKAWHDKLCDVNAITSDIDTTSKSLILFMKAHDMGGL